MQSGISQVTSFTQQVRRMRDGSFLLDSSTANAILTGRWRCQSPLAAWSVPLQTFYFHWSGKSNRNPKQRVINYKLFSIVIQVASSRPGPSNLLTCDLRHTSCQKQLRPLCPPTAASNRHAQIELPIKSWSVNAYPFWILDWFQPWFETWYMLDGSRPKNVYNSKVSNKASGCIWHTIVELTNTTFF